MYSLQTGYVSVQILDYAVILSMSIIIVLKLMLCELNVYTALHKIIPYKGRIEMFSIDNRLM